MKWIGSPVAEIWPFAYLWEYGTPILGEGEVVGVSEVERAMVVSYSLSIVTIALSVTIRPQFAIECFRCSNQQGWVSSGPNLGCSPWSIPKMFGSAENEHPRLTNGEIISDVFQPMWSQITNVTERQTDRQTERRHAIAIPRFALKCIAR